MEETLKVLEDIISEIETYMEAKWNQVSDADAMGAPTLDDWKYHMAEASLDIVERKINEIKKGE